MAGTFPRTSYANAAPQRSRLNQRKERGSGWRTTSSTARASRIQSQLKGRSRSRRSKIFCSGLSYLEIAIADLKAATGSGSVRRARSVEENRSGGRKAINAGIGIVVRIEDTADLMP
jgi:hypothetical protein